MPWPREILNAALVAMLAVATSYAFYLVWNNRASEKIVTTVLPIAVGALLGIYLAVFVFGGEAAITTKFATSFFYREADRLPLAIPYRPTMFSLFEVPELFRKDANTKKTEATLLYHHLLQKSIIELFAEKYRGNWETEIVDLKLPHGREEHFQPAPSSTERSRTLLKAELNALLHENLFAGVDAPLLDRLAVPLDTQIVVITPTVDEAGFHSGQITFANPFCKVSIKTQPAGGLRGIALYGRMVGISDTENNTLWTSTYFITVNATFTKSKSGHPKMPKYKAWVQQMIHELHKRFDEERIWADVKDSYLLMKELPRPGSSPTLQVLQ